LLVTMIVGRLFFIISLWWYILVFVFWLVITAIGSFNMSWNFHLSAINSHPTSSSKKIAITFDDGPNPDFTPVVLKLLEDYNAKATFFCIGKHAKKYPELLNSITTQGHLIGNHSYTHNYFIDFKDSESWIEEIRKTDI